MPIDSCVNVNLCKEIFLLLADAFDAVHLEAVKKENAEMRRIFLFRFILKLISFCNFMFFFGLSCYVPCTFLLETEGV